MVRVVALISPHFSFTRSSPPNPLLFVSLTCTTSPSSFLIINLFTYISPAPHQATLPSQNAWERREYFASSSAEIGHCCCSRKSERFLIGLIGVYYGLKRRKCVNRLLRCIGVNMLFRGINRLFRSSPIESRVGLTVLMRKGTGGGRRGRG